MTAHAGPRASAEPDAEAQTDPEARAEGPPADGIEPEGVTPPDAGPEATGGLAHLPVRVAVPEAHRPVGGPVEQPPLALDWVDDPRAVGDRPPLGPRALAALRRGPVTFAQAATRVFTAVALLGVWCVFFVVGLSSLETARDQDVLYAELRSELALETAPTGGYITPGAPVALIEAPEINLRYVVVEGTTSGDLRAGPGHLRYTPLPGQAGVSVIYGRALAFGGPFRDITKLTSGDSIIVTTQEGTFTYLVDRVRRAGDPIPDQLASDASRLRLVTAEGVSWRDGWAADEAVYVDANLQGATQPTPAGRVSGVPNSEQALQGDPSARVPLLLWLQLLLATLIGCAWALARWGGAQVWLVGVPAILAALWGTTESFLQLLPNLM